MKKILIVDPHTVFAEGLQVLIQADPEFTVPAIAATGQEALTLAGRHRPDLVTLEISLPDMTGMDLAARIRRQHPRMKILALTGQTHPLYINGMLHAGATGYLTKHSRFSQVFAAIKNVLQGGLAFSQDLADSLISRDPDLERINCLSSQQLQILTLIAQGYPPKAIADQVHLSLKTVQYHHRRILDKLNQATDADLIRLAVKTGLVSL